LAIKLGSIYGIPLYLDYTWFIIFALIVYTVGFLFFPEEYSKTSFTFAEELILGVLSAFLLFGSVLVHELAHSIVAKRNGLQIGRITLYLFGGVSEMTEEPPNANLELKMAAAGPLTSIVIALILGALWYVANSAGASILFAGPLLYAFLINLIVAAFNLIPAFPLDGGRILRSILWHFNNDVLKATKIASTVGRIFAYLMMFGGIVLFLFTGDIFDGVWLVLIGWFISSGATSELRQQIVQEDLAPLKVRDIMTRTVDSVSPDMTANDLSIQFMERKHNGFPVMEGDELVGCVTMHDLRHAGKESWNTLRVRDIMVPKDKVITVRESDPAKKALQLMSQNKIGRVFVLVDTGSKLAGIVTRTDIMKTIEMRESSRSGAFGSAQSEKKGEASMNTITVDNGMLFELTAPVGETTVDWAANFDQASFALVSTRLVQLADLNQTLKHFTFQAMKKGRFFITLAPTNVGGKGGARPSTYIVVVN
jgi:Zn-dependent protease/CBS domain-containing protein